MRTKLYYTDTEYRNEDGEREKYVYVPLLDEWMTLDEFYFEKQLYDDSMEDAEIDDMEHGRF